MRISLKIKHFLKLIFDLWMAIWTKLAYAYTYDAQNLCVGVIFDCEQSDHNFFFKFELFGFFRNKIWDPPVEKNRWSGFRKWPVLRFHHILSIWKILSWLFRSGMIWKNGFWNLTFLDICFFKFVPAQLFNIRHGIRPLS